MDKRHFSLNIREEGSILHHKYRGFKNETKFLSILMAMSTKRGRFKIFNNSSDLKDAFREKSIRTLRLADTRFCIAQIGNSFFAFEALCPHQKHSLVESSINGFEEIICPLHFYRFNLKTGQEASRLCHDLTTYKIEETADGVFVHLH